MTKYFKLIICCIVLAGFFYCINAQNENRPYIQVLGIAQDGGYPHAGCEKQCCERAWQNDSLKKSVVCLALVDPLQKKWWMFEATPDIKTQLYYFRNATQGQYPYLPEGILLTHAHIGHYTGLMDLGKEVMDVKNIAVYVLPRMKTFLENNGPWSQLVSRKNISLIPVEFKKVFSLGKDIQVEAFKVPHRDEYSETAGFKITASGKKYLFIPDIDKWEKWEENIVKEVSLSDVSFLDATFSEASELPDRKIEEVPHPLVSETIHLFSKSDNEIKSKIFFIHFNHTNPLLWDADKKEELLKLGFNVAEEGKKY